MKRTSTGIAVGTLAALSFCTAAFAGLRQNQEVVYWPGVFLDVAYGFLGSARNSADATQQLGCFSRGNTATCSGTTATGQSFSCSTSSASQLAAIHSLNSDAYLLIGWDNATGICEFVYARNMSYTPPKAP